jgi:hypothetical protein
MPEINRVSLLDGQWVIDWSALTSLVESYYRCAWRNTLRTREDIDKYVVQQSPESFAEKVFRSSVTIFSKDRKTYIVTVDHEEVNRKARVSADSYVRQLRDYAASGRAGGDALAKRLAEVSNSAAAEAKKFAVYCAQVESENLAGMNADVAKYGTAAAFATGVRDTAVAVEASLLAAYLFPAGLAGASAASTALARGCVTGSFELALDLATGALATKDKADAKIVKVTGSILLDFVKAAASGGKVATVVKISAFAGKAALDGASAIIEGETAREAVRLAIVNAGVGFLADRILQSSIVSRQINRLQVHVAGDVVALNPNWRRDAGAAGAAISEAAGALAKAGIKTAAEKTVDAAFAMLDGGSSIDAHAPALRIARVSAAIHRA